MKKKIEKIFIDIDYSKFRGGHIDYQETLKDKINEIIERLNENKSLK